MGKVQERLQAIRLFFAEVFSETKKTNWPDRHELLDSTLVVIVLVLLMGTYVGFCDALLVVILKFLTP